MAEPDAIVFVDGLDDEPLGLTGGVELQLVGVAILEESSDQLGDGHLVVGGREVDVGADEVAGGAVEGFNAFDSAVDGIGREEAGLNRKDTTRLPDHFVELGLLSEVHEEVAAIDGGGHFLRAPQQQRGEQRGQFQLVGRVEGSINVSEVKASLRPIEDHAMS